MHHILLLTNYKCFKVTSPEPLSDNSTFVTSGIEQAKYKIIKKEGSMVINSPDVVSTGETD